MLPWTQIPPWFLPTQNDVMTLNKAFHWFPSYARPTLVVGGAQKPFHANGRPSTVNIGIMTVYLYVWQMTWLNKIYTQSLLYNLPLMSSCRLSLSTTTRSLQINVKNRWSWFDYESLRFISMYNRSIARFIIVIIQLLIPQETCSLWCNQQVTSSSQTWDQILTFSLC